MDNRELRVILAEDDDGHATLIRRNMRRASLQAEVTRARDGSEALTIIRNEFERSAGRRPMLLILDIRMPGIDGTEVLQTIKSDEAMRRLPVYVLSTTDNPAEIERCFQLGCNAYLTKPVSYDAFEEAVQRLCRFIEVTRFPWMEGGY